MTDLRCGLGGPHDSRSGDRRYGLKFDSRQGLNGGSGAEEAAEKWGSESESAERLPSGPEGRIDFAELAARVNSCPFKTPTFSAACEARLVEETVSGA